MGRLLSAVLLGSVVTGLATAWWLGGQLTAPALRAVGSPPEGLHCDDVELLDVEGRVIRGWVSRAPASRATALLLHGIRGDRTAMVRRAKMLRAHGISSVLIDLQAHGESAGTRIALGARARHGVEAAVDWIHASYPSDPVFVIGVSLGGAAAVLASPLGIEGLVLESVYPDVQSAIGHRVQAQLGVLAPLPAWLLLVQLEPRLGVKDEQLRPVDSIASVGCPLLVIAGAEDPHTPVLESERLFKYAREPKALWIVPGAAHVDLERAAPLEYQRRTIAFIEAQLGLDLTSQGGNSENAAFGEEPRNSASGAR